MSCVGYGGSGGLFVYARITRCDSIEPDDISSGETNDHVDVIWACGRLVHIMTCNKGGKAHTSQRLLEFLANLGPNKALRGIIERICDVPTLMTDELAQPLDCLQSSNKAGARRAQILHLARTRTPSLHPIHCR